MLNKIKVGISIGDPNGIGLEIILKTFQNGEIFDSFLPIVFANFKLVEFQKKYFNLKTKIVKIKSINYLENDKLNIVDSWNTDYKINFGLEDKTAGELSFISLSSCSNALKKGEVDAMLTAPINKANIQSVKFKFKGHTDYLNNLFNNNSLMMMVSNNLIIGLLTDHIPLNQIVSNLSENLIIEKLKILHNSLIKDFKIPNPNIAILSINPHAGDKGIIGSEDDEIIIPVLHRLNKENIQISGPFSSDSFFGSRKYKEYSAVMGIYHDQALIPFKTLSFGSGVNFTAGLDIIRTSPDHGTGFDIAGKNIANNSSFFEALLLLKKVYKNRNMLLI
tara:strand:+ start:349 stop:1350 length:1002 start_codon:yes stop_codon:yes gene_type:complete